MPRVGTDGSAMSSSLGSGMRATGSVSRRALMRSASPLKAGMRGDADCSAARVADTAEETSESASTPSDVGVSPAASRRFTYASAGVVMSVMTGTSVIANAPLRVWMARCRRSSAGLGSARLACSQVSMVARWPVTSVPRISSSTGSTDAGMPGSSSTWGASGSAGALSTLVAASSSVSPSGGCAVSTASGSSTASSTGAAGGT